MNDADMADLDVELRELRYFVAVAEELNFTRAALRLGMAQPPLSAAIAKLERRLATKLLERTTRSVNLTPAGAVLLDQARIAIEAATAAVERTRREGAKPGRLTVAVKPGTGTGLLKAIIEQCAHDPSMPEIRLLFGHPGGPAAAVRSGAADIAILRAPFARHGLDCETLLVEPRVAALPAKHRLAGHRELRRADLADEPMPRWTGDADPATVAYWTGTDTAPPPDQAARPRALVGPEINDITQLLDAVALTNAVAYVPASTADRHRCAQLAFVPVSDLSPSRIVATWPDNSRSPAVARFIRTAAHAASIHTASAHARHGSTLI